MPGWSRAECSSSAGCTGGFPNWENLRRGEEAARSLQLTWEQLTGPGQGQALWWPSPSQAEKKPLGAGRLRSVLERVGGRDTLLELHPAFPGTGCLADWLSESLWGQSRRAKFRKKRLCSRNPKDAGAGCPLYQKMSHQAGRLAWLNRGFGWTSGKKEGAGNSGGLLGCHEVIQGEN